MIYGMKHKGYALRDRLQQEKSKETVYCCLYPLLLRLLLSLLLLLLLSLLLLLPLLLSLLSPLPLLLLPLRPDAAFIWLYAFCPCCLMLYYFCYSSFGPSVRDVTVNCWAVMWIPLWLIRWDKNRVPFPKIHRDRLRIMFNDELYFIIFKPQGYTK